MLGQQCGDLEHDGTVHHRRCPEAAGGCALRDRPGTLSGRSALRLSEPRGAVALAARACADRGYRRLGGAGRSGRAGGADGGGRGRGRAASAAPDGGGERADRGAVRLPAAAVAGIRQGALRRRTRGAGGGGYARAGDGCGRVGGGRVCCAAGGDRCRCRARPGRAGGGGGSARQCLPELAHGEHRSVRGGFCHGGLCRAAAAGQPSHRYQPDGAARAGGAVRPGRGSLHGLCLQPEHPPEPGQYRQGARPAAVGRAVHRAGCRGRVRGEEFHLCRAGPDFMGGAAGRAAGEVDREPQRGVPVRSPGARSPCGCGAGAGCGGEVPGAAGGERGEYRRLYGGRRRRGADVSVCAPAGHRVCHSGDRPDRRGGGDQHRADRRDQGARLCRDGEHHRAADRRGGAAGWFRSGRVAADQHGAGGRDADDQRLRAGRGQRRFSRHVRPGAGTGRCGRISGAARGERGTGQTAWPGLRLSYQGDRRVAARERGYPFRGRRHGVPDHRHADDRPGA